MQLRFMFIIEMRAPIAKLYSSAPRIGLFEGKKNAVLMYHSIGRGFGDPDGTILSQKQFNRTLRYLNNEFEIVDLPAILEECTESSPGKKIALSFDDAYADFYENALPVLRDYDIPATLFVITDCIGQTGPTDVTTAPGEPSFMTAVQLQEIADGDLVTIGNHTKTHPDLTSVGDEDTLHEEIIGGKRALESRFGTTVDRFCYPGGKFDERCLEIVEQSHSLAVTATRGLISANQDPYRIPRIDGNQPDHLLRWSISDVSDALWRL